MHGALHSFGNLINVCAARVGTGGQGSDLAYQAVTVAAMVLVLAGIWVF